LLIRCYITIRRSEPTSGRLDEVVDVDTKSILDHSIHMTASYITECQLPAENVNLLELVATSPVVRHAVALVDDRRVIVVRVDNLETNCIYKKTGNSPG